MAGVGDFMKENMGHTTWRIEHCITCLSFARWKSHQGSYSPDPCSTISPTEINGITYTVRLAKSGPAYCVGESRTIPF